MADDAERRRKALQDQHELEESAKFVLQNRQSRRFILWLVEITTYHGVNLSGNSSVYATEGMRQVGKRVLDLFEKIDPTAYPAILMDLARDEQKRRLTGDQAQHVSDDTGNSS